MPGTNWASSTDAGSALAASCETKTTAGAKPDSSHPAKTSFAATTVLLWMVTVSSTFCA